MLHDRVSVSLILLCVTCSHSFTHAMHCSLNTLAATVRCTVCVIILVAALLTLFLTRGTMHTCSRYWWSADPPATAGAHRAWDCCRCNILYAFSSGDVRWVVTLPPLRCALFPSCLHIALMPHATACSRQICNNIGLRCTVAIRFCSHSHVAIRFHFPAQ